jgi:hypothetical protein
MKVRCLVQTMVTSNTHLNGEDQQQAETVRLLSGSDDKTIKLFSLSVYIKAREGMFNIISTSEIFLFKFLHQHLSQSF